MSTWGTLCLTDREDVLVGENGLEYPSRYAPGQGIDYIDDAWEIVDVLGHRIDSSERALLAGMILGTLFKHRDRTRSSIGRASRS